MTLRSIYLAAALSATITTSAVAQVPHLQVYTDPSLTETFYRCGAANTMSEVFVVLSNANFEVSAVDLHIDYPPSMMWLADLPPDAGYTGTEWVTIGNSPTGIAIAWANCCMRDGSQGPFVVMRSLVYWLGQCTCTPIGIGGYEALGKSQPTLVRNGDFQEFPAVGLPTYYNPYFCDVPVQPTTWGSVKALYR